MRTLRRMQARKSKWMESKINGRNKIKSKKHYICNTDTYFSEKFHTYFDHSLNDWETADLHCVSNLEANYEIVLDLFDLKRLVKSIDLVDRLKQAIADYDSIYGGEHV